MRNRARWLFLLSLALLTMTGIVFAGSSAAQNDRSPFVDRANPLVNLLGNPSFEGGFHTYIPPNGHPDCPTGICQTVQIADDWNPWWLPSDPANDIANPEYKPAAPYDYRIQSGSNAQQYFTTGRLHEAGIYQRVSATPGQQYRFKIWGHAWSSNKNNPYQSESTLEQRIGIDPTGGTNWESNKIVWGPLNQQYDVYGVFYVCATAVSNHITAFTYSRPIWPVLHNDVYWDSAVLEPYNGDCQLGLEVSPNVIDLLVESDKLGISNTTIDIKLPDEPGIKWHAGLEPGGTITPTLSASSGSAGQDLTVTVNSNGLPLGEYAANLVISSDPPVPGSPQVVPINLEVVPEIILSLHVLPETIGFLADVDEPGQMSMLAKIKIPFKPGITWNAEIVPGGTFTPILSATSGSWGENITVMVDSSSVPIGRYLAHLKITTNPSVPGNPVTVPVFLSVVEEIQTQYMPVTSGP